MAPGAGGKRKRPERSWSDNSGTEPAQRPSPHRPSNLNMAQHPPQQHRDHLEPGPRGRGRRQSGRGGRSGGSSRRPSSDGQKDNAATSPANPTSTKETPDPIQTNGNIVGAVGNQQVQPRPSPSPAPPTDSSQQTQSQPQLSSQPEPAPAAQPVPGPPMPYDYEYVTDSVLEGWMAGGRQKLVEDGVEAKNQQDAAKLAALYQELIRSAIYGRLPPTDSGAVVKDIIGEEVAAQDIDMEGENPTPLLDIRALFLDTLSIVTDSDTSNSALKPLVFSTGINASLMRLQLDTPLLQSLGLVRDTFARMGIRKQTNLLYRQSNYNLLREESEGYSKLLTELFTTSNNEPPSSEVVEDTFERVKAMIGAFDMDVGRVLDVTLDVFAAVLVKQYRFFVKLLRVSSWWPKEDTFRTVEGSNRDSGLPNWALPGSTGWVTTDEERAGMMQANAQRDQDFWKRVREIGIRAFFEIGRKPLSQEEKNQILPETSALSEEENEVRKWVEETGTLPPKGSRVAAQLLGFKLRFYSSRARSKLDVLPDNLIYLAALLIKVGFISLRDLYPHLWRPDDSMDALKDEKLKEKEERERAARPGGGINALMMAGALSDDTLPAPRVRETEARATPGKEDGDKAAAAAKAEEEELPEPSDQKVLLLKSLLAIGALPESLFILSKFPWLMDVYPELPEFIHRVLHQCLSKVYSSLRPLPSVDGLRDQQQIAHVDQSSGRGHIRLSQAPPRRVLRWAQLDVEDTNDGIDYRFYWDDWADNVPVCQSVDDVFALCSSFLNLSGHKIGQDASLLSKLARIGKDSLTKDGSQENRARWQDLCKRLLVPSISLTKANPGVVNEIFDLISFFSREIRYNMYAEWNFGQTSRLPDIKSAFDQARAETKDVLKRLSKTNIRPMARALAKIAYANPGIVINVAISQIESYENLIEVVVECARYFTYLGYDILTWELINSLGQKGRSRVQEGGLLTSRWLNALATFAGRTFKRYSVMDPTPVLQYVVEQLRHNNSTDLIVLEQVISSMAGIITDTNFNDAQIQAMAGGETLQSQTILQLLDKRHESKTTSKRLLKSLTVSKLAGQLLVAIAQERLTCIFRESEEGSSELKLLGNIVDEIHRILTQYVDLLRSNMTTEEFDSFVPDLPSLIKDFGIQPEIAFWIQRPSVGKKIADVERVIQEEEAAAKSRESEVASTTKPDEGQPEMAVDGEPTPDGMDVDKPQVENANESDSTTPATEQQAVTSQGAVGSFASNAVVQDLEEQIKAVLPTDTYGIVGLRFYVVFWQLSLYDVHVPQKAYEDEIERQKKKVVSINNDRSDISMAGTHRKEREKKQITQLQERILEENKTHLKAYGQTRTRLQKEKDRWFAGMRGNYDSLNVSLLEQCFLPRLLLSPIEAFYCFKVLKFLHASGTPNFRTVGLLDQLFREQRITALIFQCTSKEADNFGHFLNETLRDLGRWHADKAVYEKEAFGTKRDLPGFATIVDPEGKPTTFLEYEDFRRLLYKWHRLLASALKICLNGGEYMHIRNAISVLKAIVQQFPAVNWIGRDMLTSVNNLSHNDERDDVKTPAASLIGDLNRREKKWMLPQAFNEIKGPVAAAANQAPKNESSPSDKTAAGASRPQSATPAQLNASAPTFKPSDAQESEGAAKPETTKAEVEDGEIEDAKMTDVAMKGMDEASQLQEPSGKVETEAEAGSEKGQEQPLSDKPAAESASESTSRAQLSPGPAASQPETQPSGQGRQAEPPKRPEPERAPASSSSSRSLPNRPSRQGDGRLPARPDFPNDRRPRHPEYPRGGRYDGEHDYGRPFEGDGRNYGPLDRELVTRPPPDDSFRGPGYRDGRLPREPDWPDRPGRVRAPPDVFLGRPDAIREAPSGPRPGPLTHPDRAELIHDRPERDRRGMPPRALSPPRPADLPVRPERFPPDDRRFANYPTPPSRHDDMPTGPRSERLGRGEVLEPREPPTGPEMSHGRLRQQEPPADTPSGPRVRNAGGRSGRGASSTTAAQPPSQPAAGGTERQPPSGPGRQGARGSQAEQGAAGGPQSPNSDRLDNSGIHPDRLKALQKQGNDGTYSGARPQQPPSPGTIAPPSGPRSGFAPPAGLPSMPRAAPAPGPSMGERGRGDKRFAGINTMLQQSAGPTDRSGTGTTIRGRGANRAAAANAPSPQSTRPQTPSGTPDDGSRAGAPQQGRPDLLADRISNAPRPDEGPSRSRHGSGRGDLLEDPGSEPRRSVRNSSSTHERERDRERERERDRDRDRDRDHRDRSERERERDRDRDRERDRRGDDEGTTRSNSRREERAREYDRERSRRSDAEPPREVLRRGGGSGARDDTRRRERRERDDGSDMASSGSHEHEGRLRPPSSMGAPPPPPPPPPPLPGSAEDERRWSGGRERERERNRDRGRDRDYHRDGGGGGGGGSGGGHRKRGRTGEDGGAQGEGGREGGGRGGGGMRMGSESKRPRRGM